MAFFASNDSNGDIWASNVFSEESTLNDLLETGDYTLEQLLSEDELLQELKGLLPALVSFLSRPSVCRELITYATMNRRRRRRSGGSSSYDNDDDLRIRFPYMACEVVCCEVPSIVDTLADGHCEEEKDDDDGTGDEERQQQQQLQPPPQEDEFDSVTCDDGSREPEPDRTTPMGTGGETRMLDVLFHFLEEPEHDETDDGESEEKFRIDDRSAGYFEKILSILIRHRPVTISSYLNERAHTLLPLLFKHVYSYSIMQILLRLLTPNDDAGESVNHLDINGEAHVTDNTSRTCDWIDNDLTMDLLFEDDEDADGVAHRTEILVTLLQSSEPAPLHKLLEKDVATRLLSRATTFLDSPNESPSTHVLRVLEAVLLRAGGYGGAVPLPLESLLPLVPDVLETLRSILTSERPTWRRETTAGFSTTTCGAPRLRGARVLEALVLLGDERIDECLVENGSDVVGAVCDLFWETEWCSALHQSVANMVVHVIEGRNKRHCLQNYLVNGYDILGSLLKAFKKNDEAVRKTRFRLGHMGHVVIMCQALEHVEYGGSGGSGGNVENGTNVDEILRRRSNDEGDDLTSVREQSNFEKKFVPSANDSNIEIDLVENARKPESNFEKDFVLTNNASETETDLDNDEEDDHKDESKPLPSTAQAVATPIPPDDDDNDDELQESTSQHQHSSSKLVSFLRSHPSYSAWCEVRTTVLAETTAAQSAPLGGPRAAAFAEDNRSSGDEFDMNDHNLLDIAADVMEGMYLGTETLGDSIVNDPVDVVGSNKYSFDDPLGRIDEDFDAANITTTTGETDDVGSAPVIDFYVRSKDSEDEDDDVEDSDDEGEEDPVPDGEDEEAPWADFPVTEFSSPPSDTIKNHGGDEHDSFSFADFSAFDDKAVSTTTTTTTNGGQTKCKDEAPEDSSLDPFATDSSGFVRPNIDELFG